MIIDILRRTTNGPTKDRRDLILEQLKQSSFFSMRTLARRKKAAFVLLEKHQIITNEGRKSAGSNRFRPEMVTNFQQVQQNPSQRFDK